MGIHPKIGITGLPRSGKSAVMEKVLEMLVDERTREINIRGNPSGKPIVGGMRTEPILENGERLGYKVINIITNEFPIFFIDWSYFPFERTLISNYICT